jgi:adenosylcobinamide kinase / adenosylcobinamide-phosphate guanylyltransferase
MHHLILGGQKSGKSARAEMLARDWLAADASHRAVLIATATAGDEEMRQRIARHQADRALRVPAMQTVEEPLALASCIARHADAKTLVIVDCLTLWLTNLLMPFFTQNIEQNRQFARMESAQSAMNSVVSLLDVLGATPSPVILVSNEIGLGVIPLGADVRRFVDELGKLNQAVAARCERVTLMAAGCALALKEPS